MALVALFISSTVTSCKDKSPKSDSYRKNLAEMAAKMNKDCPKATGNRGDTLQAVTFDGKALTYRLKISDEILARMNQEYLDKERDSIVKGLSSDLKKFLVKGGCDYIRKYVSPNDSCSITIIPKELEASVEGGEK